jgi:ABC-2 type transport system ATP-binding protein
MIVLQVENVHKMFRSGFSLKNINFQIETGHVYGFMGPNGAGKTTTLKIILNYLSPDSGLVLYKGQPVSKLSQLPAIGYMPDVPGFFEQLTGLEYIRFYQKLYHIPDPEIDEKISSFNLQKFLSNKIATYSLGTKKKLALFLSLLGEKDFIILDEPFTGLDPVMINEFRTILQKSVSEGKALMISSHILSEVEKVCDRFIMIDNGEIIFNGSDEQLYEEFVKIPNQISKELINHNESIFHANDHIILQKKFLEPDWIMKHQNDVFTPDLEELFLYHVWKNQSDR